jgi:SAM-dependent methyltransferase
MFVVSGAEYDRFMGRYSVQLAPLFADFVGVKAGDRALDVGCGPGALTVELARRVGAGLVAAVDPAPQFVEACRQRVAGADVRVGGAETLPWPDATFDVALAQLVLTFMSDAPGAVREMRRVVRPGGTVAACMWESGGGMPMIESVWRAVALVDPAGTAARPKGRFHNRAEIEELFCGAFPRCELASLEVASGYDSFDDYWTSLLGAGGNLGAYVSRLDEPARARLRAATYDVLGRPTGPLRMTGRAWAARGRSD